MIEIIRGNTVIWSGKAKGQLKRKAMQYDFVEVELNLPAMLLLELGDTIEVEGRLYKLNNLPDTSQKIV